MKYRLSNARVVLAGLLMIFAMGCDSRYSYFEEEPSVVDRMLTENWTTLVSTENGFRVDFPGETELIKQMESFLDFGEMEIFQYNYFTPDKAHLFALRITDIPSRYAGQPE